MTVAEHVEAVTELQTASHAFTDMDRWHERMGCVRREVKVVPVDTTGPAPFPTVLGRERSHRSNATPICGTTRRVRFSNPRLRSE